MHIKVLGAGCINCQRLKHLVDEVVKEFGVSATVEEVHDFGQIMAYGVMATPALVINEKVRLAGMVPDKAKLVSLITTAMAEEGKN